MHADPPNILHIRLANVEAAEVACEQYLTFREQALTQDPSLESQDGIGCFPGAFNEPGNKL